jgi:hypothetical protein
MYYHDENAHYKLKDYGQLVLLTREDSAGPPFIYDKRTGTALHMGSIVPFNELPKNAAKILSEKIPELKCQT